jgi:hypothetical protein
MMASLARMQLLEGVAGFYVFPFSFPRSKADLGWDAFKYIRGTRNHVRTKHVNSAVL